MSNLTSVVKSIQDIMRQDSGVDGDAQRISQLTWLLFLKIFDAQEEELELTRDEYRSPIPEKLRWRNWAADAEGLTGEKLLDFVNGQLFPNLKGLSADIDRNSRGFVVRSVFEDAFNYMKSGQLLRQVANKINGIEFNRKAERHQFNDIYETILKDLQSAGNAGEFYTPRAVTQFMVEVVTPRLGETFFDPACGTGGFLVGALEHLRKQVKTPKQELAVQRTVRGVEKKQLPHLLCVTNMLLHGVEIPSTILHDNTLTRPLRDYGPKDRVDLIVTNPPFGGTEEPGIESNFPADVRTKETADLFLVLMKHLLKPGGRGAIVLPDGTLFGEGVKTRIKEQLLTECNLHTIVRLPNGVFNPYTGIKTNLLFFTKGTSTKDTWYYEHQYPRGYKSYSKTKPIRIEEFDAEKAWWGRESDGFKSRVENEFAWKVSVDTFKANNYNLDQKNPHSPDEVSHDPELVLKEYQRLQSEARQVRDELKAMLGDAFSSIGFAPSISASPKSRQVVSGCDSRRTHTSPANVFELLTTAPEGVKRLRELILSLAVRGRLVRQLAEDEPASKLLPKIRTEKAALLLKGVLKRERPLPAIAQETIPFDVPPNWVWARLGDLAKKVTDGTHHSPPNHRRGDFKYISAKNIKSWGIDLSDLTYVTKEIHDEIYSRCNPELGDVLYIKDGATTGVVTVNTLDEPFSMLSSVGLMKPSCGISARYLATVMASPFFYRTMRADMTGVAITRVTIGKLNMALIPLPPLQEQKRIVERVAQLMVACDSLENSGQRESQQHAHLTSVLVGHLL